MRGAAFQVATASGVNHTVRLPRARRPASYSAQLVTRCRCFAMWRRQAALALNGTAEIQASGKGPSSYTAQLPTPTGRSMQQGGSLQHGLDIPILHPVRGHQHVHDRVAQKLGEQRAGGKYRTSLSVVGGIDKLIFQHITLP